MKPVNGILSLREFLNLLAFRTFACTQYIRHPEFPKYSPEPDIVHEYLGHIPMFSNPVICDINQKLGKLSLGATDSQIAAIGAIYWYTVEVGILMEKGERKFFGASIGSSIEEIEQFLNASDKDREFNLKKEMVYSDYFIEDIQPFYYRIPSFNNMIEQLNDLSNSIQKPFNLKYDSASKSYQVDRKIIMEEKPADL